MGKNKNKNKASVIRNRDSRVEEAKASVSVLGRRGSGELEAEASGSGSVILCKDIREEKAETSDFGEVEASSVGVWSKELWEGMWEDEDSDYGEVKDRSVGEGSKEIREHMLEDEDSDSGARDPTSELQLYNEGIRAEKLSMDVGREVKIGDICLELGAANPFIQAFPQFEEVKDRSVGEGSKEIREHMLEDKDSDSGARDPASELQLYNEGIPAEKLSMDVGRELKIGDICLELGAANPFIQAFPQFEDSDNVTKYTEPISLLYWLRKHTSIKSRYLPQIPNDLNWDIMNWSGDRLKRVSWFCHRF